jgi:hypothetical protein
LKNTANAVAQGQPQARQGGAEKSDCVRKARVACRFQEGAGRKWPGGPEALADQPAQGRECRQGAGVVPASLAVPHGGQGAEAAAEQAADRLVADGALCYNLIIHIC